MASLVVKLKQRRVSRYVITRSVTTIGRDPSCDLRLDNMGVSRQHAVIRVRQGTFVVQDGGSANGLFVNGVQVGEQVLRDGDWIQVGKFNVVFEPDSMPVPIEEVDESAPARRLLLDDEATYAMGAADIRRALERSQSLPIVEKTTEALNRTKLRVRNRRASALCVLLILILAAAIVFMLTR